MTDPELKVVLDHCRQINDALGLTAQVNSDSSLRVEVFKEVMNRHRWDKDVENYNGGPIPATATNQPTKGATSAKIN